MTTINKKEIEQNDYHLPTWAWIIVIVIGILYIVGGSLVGLIFLVIDIIIGFKCMDWASQIKADKTWAFFVGFLFGLIGMLIYWNYYKKELKDKEIPKKKDLTEQEKREIIKEEKEDLKHFIGMVKFIGIIILIAIIVYFILS